MASDVIVVARRWDGLGGRLHAVLNAWSVARALDLEFRFVWPRNLFTSLHDPREIFDDGFLARFEITEADCHPTALPVPAHLSVPEAKELCRAAAAHSMIDVWQCFDVLAFAGESAAGAAARFRGGLNELGWSAVVRALMESISRAGDAGGYCAIHIRAGDIVDGDWRQFVPVEKLVPTAFVDSSVTTLSGPEAARVVVASDNQEYVRYLKSRFRFVCAPADLVEGYDRLTEAQRALADVLVLSRARRLVGPRSSAFSQLAAHIGGLEVSSIGDDMPEETARHTVRDGIVRTGRADARRKLVRSLLARDICWYLDVFTEHLAVGEYLQMARRAVRLEPDFCGALNRLATAAALVGDERASARASSRAVAAAELARVHADPMFESLATSISNKLVIAFGLRRRAGRRLAERLGFTQLRTDVAGGAGVSTLLDEIDDDIERCERLTPYQTDHGEVMLNLRFQRAALSWISAADERSREAATRAMRGAPDALMALPSWRPSGFSSISNAGSFPQTVRNLEIASIRMARALARSFSGAALREPPSGHIESIRTSPSGLRWATGWAFDPGENKVPLRVGLFFAGGIVSAGATSTPRPDVAATLGDPRALVTGFAFPMPLALSGEVDALRSNLRIGGGPRRAQGS